MTSISFSSIVETLYPELDLSRAGLPSITSASDVHIASLPDAPETEKDVLETAATLQQISSPWQQTGTAAVFLAGGKGSRMGDEIPQKVLSPIAGKPALRRAMQLCLEQGIEDFIVIVGYGYKHVVEALDEFPGRVTFLYQDMPLGTGHAARFASRFLQRHGFGGDALILMGDKWIQPKAFHQLKHDHLASNADLTLTAGDKSDWPDSGRVVLEDDGTVCCIVEKPDIVRSQLVEDFLQWPGDPVHRHEFMERALHYWNRPQKMPKVLGESFWNQWQQQESISKNDAELPYGESGLRLSVDGTKCMSGHEIEAQCRWVNLSVYWMKADAFYTAMESLKPNNVQGELYLTDAVHYLTAPETPANYRVACSAMPDKQSVMGFNTPEELAAIEQAVTEATPDETAT